MKQEREIMKLYMPLRAVSFYEEDDYGNYEPCEYPEVLTNRELTAIEQELSQKLADYQEYETDRELAEYMQDESLKEKVHSFHFEFEEIAGELWGVAVAEIIEPLSDHEIGLFKAEISGCASDGVGEGFEQQDIKFGERDINISLWNNETEWFIQTAEEMGITEHDFGMGGIE